MSDHRGRLIDSYCSSHYSRYVPRTQAAWDRAIERLSLNFGPYFATIPRSEPVLDLPCGIGYLEHYLLSLGFESIDAVDLSQEQLDMAQKLLDGSGLSSGDQVRFHLADAFEFLKASRGYQAIAAIDFLDHLSKEEAFRFLDATLESLRPGGTLILRMTNADNPVWGRFFFSDLTHEQPYTHETARQILELCGFEPVHIGYERMPPFRGGWKARLFNTKRALRSVGQHVLGRLLDVPRGAFAEDIVAVGRKP